MDDFYPNRLASHEEIQGHHHHHHHHRQQHQRISIPDQLSASGRGPQTAHPSSSMSSAQPDNVLMVGDSLDSIIRENHHELQRRRSSVPHSFSHGAGPVSQDHPPSRRISFLEFGIGDDDFGSYHFTAGHGLQTNYPDMAGSLGLPGQMPGFGSQGVLPLSDTADFTTLSPDMMSNMIPATFANMRMNLDQMNQESSSIGLYASSVVTAHYGPGPEDFPMGMAIDDAQMGRPVRTTSSSTPPAPILSVDDRVDTVMSTTPTNATEISSPSQQPSLSLPTPEPSMGTFSPAVSQPTAALAGQASSSSASGFASPRMPTPKVTPPLGPPQTPATVQSVSTPSTMASTPLVAGPARPAQPATSGGGGGGGGTYSKSGFDCLTALWLVASRKNPEINLGAVDLSCAFVICDVQLNDCPIIYVSPNFQNLTGYHTNEILGKNCRFLQAPDGKVEAGSRREFVDDGAVYNLKEKISRGREVQQSLINYRKGGKPFLNLLTMIPISWTDTDEIRYFVGFQIDIVESPGALSSDAEAGGTQINYKHSEMGQYVWTPPQTNRWGPKNGQSLGEDDVSTLLQQLRPKGILSDWHRQSWDKMLLENVDDVVHVLSLKGIFLYMSPACKRVLEYDADELAGKSVSEYCHPSDRISVERVLKDAVPGALVNLAWRMRRKFSGYTWMESHGSLYVEQGKGRKCVILVGRQRPVLALGRRSLEMHGGMGDSDLWAKISTSGMFLFVSSNARSLLDMQPSNLVGTSIQDMMRKESRAEFGRSIEKARRGRIVSCKHEVQHRRGQVLQAQTTLYPGDAVEGEKPTFLVAQTKLVKASSRVLAPAASGGSAQVGMPSLPSPQTKFPPVPPPIGSPFGSGHGGRGGHGGHGAAAPAPASSHDSAMEAKDNLFNELRATKCSSWQFELRQMEKDNRILAEELGGLLSNKKKRKRRQGIGNMVRDCANCHTRSTPEWRRGPSGQRDLCNSCGLRYAKQMGRVSPRTSSRGDSIRGGGSSDHGRPLKNPANSKKETPPDTSEAADWEATNSGANCKSSSGGDLTPTGAKPAEGPSMPPLSQPSLDGGSRTSMAAIQEEAGAG